MPLILVMAMDFTDFETQKEVGIQLHRLKELYSTNFIQVPQNFKKTPFYQSVIIEVLILLDDLLQKLNDLIAFRLPMTYPCCKKEERLD